MITHEFVSDGNGTESTRTLTVQHRNAPAEIFALVYAEDRSELVEAPSLALEASDQDSREDWMRTAGDFNKEAFKRAFKLSGSRAKAILDGLCDGEKKLRRIKGGKYRWQRDALLALVRPDPSAVRTDTKTD